MTTDRVVTPEYAVRLCADLNATERKTLSLVLRGHSSEEIAGLIFRSRKTVDGARSSALEKLGARNMAHAAVIATKAGLA